jgi:hypothetical protein
MIRTLSLIALILAWLVSAADAADWKKYRGEFAGDSSDCIDFDSIKTDAKGLTNFRRYVIDDDKRCGPPTQYHFVEHIKVSCREVLAAGPSRDGFPVKYYSYDRTSKRGWEEGTGASRQFSRVMQCVCQDRR